MSLVRTLGWLVCIVYSSIPSYWFMVHPWAHFWRVRVRDPFRVLLPTWIAMWIVLGVLTAPCRQVLLYNTGWTWVAALPLFVIGIFLYVKAGAHFSWAQLGGLPELRASHPEDRLVTTGIRARVRHPVYLAHLCEMLAWSVGTGLTVSWILTAFAMLTGAVMVRMEDAELERRFGQQFRDYRNDVPAVLPRL